MVTVRTRRLSAMIRPSASKIRPRSGGRSTSRVLSDVDAVGDLLGVDHLEEPQAGAEHPDEDERDWPPGDRGAPRARSPGMVRPLGAGGPVGEVRLRVTAHAPRVAPIS